MRIGFIGLGNMGAGIARDLAASDATLAVFDVQKEAVQEFAALGATAVGSPKQVAEASDVVGLCVRTDDQVLDVLQGEDGLLAGAQPGLVIAVHSTLQLETLDEAHALAASAGASLVDVPVTRGVGAPASKGIVFMISGEPDVAARVADYCKPAALEIVETGPLGSALKVKMCNNVITFMMAVTLRDISRFTKATATDPEKLRQVLEANGMGSPAMLFALRMSAAAAKAREAKGGTAHAKPNRERSKVIGPAELNAALAEKDLGHALEAVAKAGVDLPAVRFCREQIRDTMFEMLGG